MSIKLRLIGVHVILMTISIMFLSCEQDPTILTEYEGVNLIANKGFDDPDWTPDQDWPQPAVPIYMTYEEVSSVTLPDGVTGAAVFRLEIKNLVDDGEFEDNPVGTEIELAPLSPWSTTGTAVADVSGVDVEGGNSLFFNIPGNTDIMEYGLSALADGYPDNSNYILRFQFLPTERKGYWFYFPLYSIATPEINLRIAEVNDIPLIVKNFPDDFEISTSEFTSIADTDQFSITGTVQSGYIDHFRIVRTDIPLRLRIILAWADGNNPEGLPLVSGWYKFSFWARSDPDALTTSNRFASGNVSIGIENALSAFPETGSPLSMNGWERINKVTFVQIDEPADPSERVLELSLSPTDVKYANSRDAGSILITAPSLELFSDKASAEKTL